MCVCVFVCVCVCVCVSLCVCVCVCDYRPADLSARGSRDRRDFQIRGSRTNGGSGNRTGR